MKRKTETVIWLVLWKTTRARLWVPGCAFSKLSQARRALNRNVAESPKVDWALRGVVVR